MYKLFILSMGPCNPSPGSPAQSPSGFEPPSDPGSQLAPPGGHPLGYLTKF